MFMKYRLKYGESLNDVANLFNTNKEYLKEINNIYFDDMVREGMDIVVPKNSENYYNTYIIEKGDSLYKIARKYNMVTDYGKFMDPIADKLLVNTTLIILALYGPIQIPVICVIIMVARDTIVDAVRMNAVRKNIVVAANIFGKLKTVLQMVALILILINDFGLDDLWGIPNYLKIGQWFIYLATLASLVSGIIYCVQNRKVFSEMK